MELNSLVWLSHAAQLRKGKTYRILGYSTFTKKVIKTHNNYKHWITTGIKTFIFMQIQ